MDPPGVEPGFPPRQGGVVPLDHGPSQFHSSGPPGSRTPISCVQGRRRSVGPAAQFPAKVCPRVELGPPPYHGGVRPEHLQTVALRESIVPEGFEPPLPLCKRGVVAIGPRDGKSSSRGGIRTHRHQPLELAALPVCLPGHRCIAGLGVEPQRVEFMRLDRAPAHPRVPGPGVEPGRPTL